VKEEKLTMGPAVGGSRRATRNAGFRAELKKKKKTARASSNLSDSIDKLTEFDSNFVSTQLE
jgi:hypothetical protein